MLGDNIFYSSGLKEKLQQARQRLSGATIFATKVKDPERFGVVTFDEYGLATGIEEKPLKPLSNFAVTGLYFYDNEVCAIARDVRPSERGELEITDINSAYIQQNKMHVSLLGRGYTWFDAGTPDSLTESSAFIQMIEQRQGLKIGCLEKIAFQHGWLSRDQLLARRVYLGKTSYGAYLEELVSS